MATATMTKSRLNLNLNEAARTELNNLAKVTDRSITELVRLALSVLKVLIDELRAGHKLVVTKADGTLVKELILPGF